jgi:hypothetical protein
VLIEATFHLKKGELAAAITERPVNPFRGWFASADLD